MKRITTSTTIFISVLFLSLSFSQMSLAQNGLSNMSFETWTVTVLGGSTPTGWFASNVTQQTSGAQNGNSYARLTCASNNSGMLVLGPNVEGAPFAVTPLALTGFYKTAGLASADTVRITGFSMKSNTIHALGTYIINSNKSAWTSFNMPFVVMNSVQGDTIQIFFMNDPGNTVGSTFDVDNISIVTNNPVKIDERSLGSSFMIYPNPAKEVLNIISKDEEASRVIVSDMHGKKISEYEINSEHLVIDLQNYAQGVYFYKILDKTNEAIFTSKFVVTE
jgi:hypothetical protein